MNNHDDFDLINEEESEGGGTRPLYWLLGIVALIAFGFAVGLAFATLSNRLGPEDAAAMPTFTPASALAVGGATPTPTLDAAGAATPTAAGAATAPSPQGNTPTVAAPVDESPAPTSTSPVAPCVEQTDPAFGDADAQLGCPTSSPQRIVWAAWEPFERGAMLWRSDNDRAYYFVGDGKWGAIDEGWSGQDFPSRGDPPPGLSAPQRGFGYVWSIRDDIFNSLGWATDAEKGFCARVQDFERGFMLQSEAVASCTADNLYNHATAGGWQPIRFQAQAGGPWRGSLGGIGRDADTPPTAGPTPDFPPAPPPATTPAAPTSADDGVSTVLDATRPREQGRLFALRASAIALDGSFEDWSDDWIPIDTVVHNEGDYIGPDDLSARAQFAWDAGGLYVAIRVRDERYRPGPDGSDLWRGDSIEINIDRALAADFDDGTANDDDYQIGLALGPETNLLTGYRWLPIEREGAFAPSGAVRPQQEDGAWRGYDVEALLPWRLFDIDGPALPVQAALGFVLAINDNDRDAPAQETILSTSPARTRHDIPTQWGTLILLE